MPNFKEALNVDVQTIEKPPLPPVAHYRWKVIGRSFGSVGNGKYDTVDFRMQAIELNEEDPTPELLDAVEACGGVNSIRLRHRFMFNTGDDEEAQAAFDKTKWYLKQFLVDHLGLMDEGSLSSLIDGAINCTCVADIRHRPDETNPDNAFAEIGRTAPDS